MDRAKPGGKRQIRCAKCEESTPDFDIVNYGSIEKGYRRICTRCFNAEVAKLEGLDKFEHIRFDPVELADCEGKAHVFHFRTRLFGPGVALEAFEVRDGNPGGYQFQAIGDPQEDILALLARLIDKIRRALSVRHIRDGRFGPEIADHRVVRGRIAWDDLPDGQIPLLMIDGQEITWDAFGRMLMSYEGWQFKLEIRDKSEEL
jgi:hypothetical protein